MGEQTLIQQRHWAVSQGDTGGARRGPTGADRVLQNGWTSCLLSLPQSCAHFHCPMRIHACIMEQAPKCFVPPSAPTHLWNPCNRRTASFSPGNCLIPTEDTSQCPGLAHGPERPAGSSPSWEWRGGYCCSTGIRWLRGACCPAGSLQGSSLGSGLILSVLPVGQDCRSRPAGAES